MRILLSGLMTTSGRTATLSASLSLDREVGAGPASRSLDCHRRVVVRDKIRVGVVGDGGVRRRGRRRGSGRGGSHRRRLRRRRTRPLVGQLTLVDLLVGIVSARRRCLLCDRGRVDDAVFFVVLVLGAVQLGELILGQEAVLDLIPSLPYVSVCLGYPHPMYFPRFLLEPRRSEDIGDFRAGLNISKPSDGHVHLRQLFDSLLSLEFEFECGDVVFDGFHNLLFSR
ncbi:hypothetical protein PFISCL1PPCAC_25859, partial [Pristionchus fissidentatus]